MGRRGRGGAISLFLALVSPAPVGGDPFFVHVEGAIILCLSTCSTRGQGESGAVGASRASERALWMVYLQGNVHVFKYSPPATLSTGAGNSYYFYDCYFLIIIINHNP